MGAGFFDRFGNLDDLFLRFHGAGTGNEGEVAAADFDIVDFQNGVIGMESTVGFLIRL